MNKTMHKYFRDVLIIFIPKTASSNTLFQIPLQANIHIDVNFTNKAIYIDMCFSLTTHILIYLKVPLDILFHVEESKSQKQSMTASFSSSTFHSDKREMFPLIIPQRELSRIVKFVLLIGHYSSELKYHLAVDDSRPINLS